MTTLGDNATECTAVSLREYIDLNLKLRDERFSDYKDTSRESLQLAYRNIEGKLDKLNELTTTAIPTRPRFPAGVPTGTSGPKCCRQDQNTSPPAEPTS